MKKTGSKLLSLLLVCVFVLGLLPMTALTARAEEEQTETVAYIDSTGALATKRAAVIKNGNNEWTDATNGGWYVAMGDVTIDRLVDVTGAVHLILCDGAALTLEDGVEIGNSTLNIYAGSTTATDAAEITGSGRLCATGGRGRAIGGGSATVNIYGGTVEAAGGTDCDGVHCSSLTVSGVRASLTATGGEKLYSYGVYCSDSLTVSDGAKLTAYGGKAAGDSYGIYCICTSDGSQLTVDGGAKVYAYGGEATGESSNSYGVYCDGGVTVSGEGTTLTASGGTLTYGDGTVICYNSTGIYCNGLTVDGGAAVEATGGAAVNQSVGLDCRVNGAIEVGRNGSSLTVTGSKATAYSFGIYCINLSVAQGGTLTAKGDDAGTNSAGVQCGALLVNGTLTAKAGEADTSTGVASTNDVTVNGTLTAKADKSTGEGSVGVACSNLTVSGTLIAKAGLVESTIALLGNSCGVLCFGTVTVDGDGATLTAEADTASGTAPDATGAGSLEAGNSYGIYCIGGDMTVSGGAMVTAAAGAASAVGGTTYKSLGGNSCGVRCESGSLTVNGGATLTAEADTASAAGNDTPGGNSFGVWCESGSVTVDGGATLSAAAKTASAVNTGVESALTGGSSCGIRCTDLTVGAVTALTAAGQDLAIGGAVVNEVPGAGNAGPDGTGAWEAIPVSTESRSLDCRKAVFPTVTLTLAPNGGTGEAVEPVVPYDTEVPIPNSPYTCTGHTFDGWNTAADGSGTAYAAGDGISLTDNLTLYAQWEAIPYAITWKDADGSVICEASVAYGKTPVCAENTPTKEADEQYTYTFAGWKDEKGTVYAPGEDLPAVTGEAAYTAIYTAAVNQYEITFVDEDGTELQSGEVEYGKVPVYEGETPTKAENDGSTYAFAGWKDEKGTVYAPGEDLPAVTGEATYTAIYSDTTKQYTVTFVDGDGTVLDETKYDYGTPAAKIAKPDDPTKAGDAQYTYTFSGWTPGIGEVTGDATYTATYSSTVNEYTIRFVNADGTVLQSGKVAYGETPEYTGATPTKTEDGENTYVFSGWTPEIVPVTGDAAYTASFTATKKGQVAAPSFIPAAGSYEGPLTVTITCATEGASVYYIADDGEPVLYSGPITLSESATIVSYAMKAGMIDSEQTAAEYTVTEPEQEEQKYTVKFVNEDGAVLQSGEYEAGETPVYSGKTPTKPASYWSTYTFAGWDKEIVPVTADATYTATYTETARRDYPVLPQPEPKPELPFTDVTKDMACYDDVKYVYDKGIMNGTSETLFEPDIPLSRAMIMTVLHRMEGEPAVEYSGVFSDVPAGQWYSDGVEWAASVGIVLGYGDGTYGAGDDVTREQLAAILWRYAKWKGYDVSVGEDTNILSYGDAFDIADWANAAMRWACGAGVLDMDADGNIRPGEPATRAEIAEAIHVFMENVAR